MQGGSTFKIKAAGTLIISAILFTILCHLLIISSGMVIPTVLIGDFMASTPQIETQRVAFYVPYFNRRPIL